MTNKEALEILQKELECPYFLERGRKWENGECPRP